MQLLFIAATTSPGMQELGSLSNYLFTSAFVMLVVMTLAYLWYTLGSARFARELAVEHAQARSSSKAKSGKAALAGGGVTTLVRSDVVLHEQPDGERPIALNRGLIAIGRIGTIVGWMAVFMLFLSLLFRTIVEQHAPWSNLYEFSVSFTTALLLCYLIFEARFHERVRAWGLYVCALAIVTLAIAIYLGITYNMISDSSQLIPALQ
ncbi:MAG TPA: hypothetical protein VKV20_18765, partial [Ktedonobacteraceae bacterium]|nr:hypothetical protein [Ktedonobacteraceae bacterium]